MATLRLPLTEHDSARLRAGLPVYWPLVLGLLILYVPTFYDLAVGLWTTDEQGHGPIILGLSLWLLVRRWSLAQNATETTSPAVGSVLFVFALLLYVLGRSQQIIIFEVGSFILILASLLLMRYGRGGLMHFWFPLFFLIFMIPLPGPVLAALTLPVKTAVSYVTDVILFAAGYPVARSGVMLHIGPYQLLVADACAGLQTLFTLEALGLFYLNVVRHTSAFRNITLALLIIPISFSANVIRVITLTLITYYFGDAAGQGFLHGFAGIVLFLSALVLIVGIDSLLQFIAIKWASRNRQASGVIRHD